MQRELKVVSPASFGNKLTTFYPQACKVNLTFSKEIGNVIGQKSNYFRYTTSEFSLISCLIWLSVERMIKKCIFFKWKRL